MGFVKSDHRRRRLRLIQTTQERTTKLRGGSRLFEFEDQELARAEASALMNQLFEECQGDPSAKLRIEHPDGTTSVLDLDRPYLTVGRNPGCDVQLNHEEISPFHSLLLWIEGALFCCDAAPGTNLSPERPSSGSGQWVTSEPIDIGPYRIALEADSHIRIPKHSPLNRSARLAADYPYVGLQFEGVKESDNLWPVNRTLTLIGRSPQCKLRLNHKSVASVQAGLMRTTEGCWLFDLARDRKTGVNGYAIDLYPVDVGDVLQIGAFQIDVVTIGAQSASTRDRTDLGDSAGRPSTSVARSSSRELQIPAEPPVQAAQEMLASAVHEPVGSSISRTEIQSTSAPVDSRPTSGSDASIETNLASPLESHDEPNDVSNPAILDLIAPSVVEPISGATLESCVQPDTIESVEIPDIAIESPVSESASSSTLASLDQLEAACVALQSDEIVAVTDAWPVTSVQVEPKLESPYLTSPAIISVVDEIVASAPSQETLCLLATNCEVPPSDSHSMAITTEGPAVELEVDNEISDEAASLDCTTVQEVVETTSSLQDSVAELEVASVVPECNETLTNVAETDPIVVDGPIAIDEVHDEIETSIESWLADIVAIPAVQSNPIALEKSSPEIDAIVDLLISDETSTDNVADSSATDGNLRTRADDAAGSGIECPAALPVLAIEEVALTPIVAAQPSTLRNEDETPRAVEKTFTKALPTPPAPTSTDNQYPAPRRTPSGMLLPRKAQHKDFDLSAYTTETPPSRIPVSIVDAQRPAIASSAATPVKAPEVVNHVSAEVTNGFRTNGHLNRSRTTSTHGRKRSRVSQSRKSAVQPAKSATDPQVIVEFIQHQQAQLAQLKAQLAELENTYNNAAGSVISYRMRDSLAKPVSETLRCHDTMQESLKQLLQQVER